MGKVLGLNGQPVETEYEKLLRATKVMSLSVAEGLEIAGLPYGFVLIFFRDDKPGEIGCACSCSKDVVGPILKQAYRGLKEEEELGTESQH